MFTIRKPGAICTMVTGKEGEAKQDNTFAPPEKWRWAEIHMADGSPHPLFLDGEGRPRQLRTINIEIISNIPEWSFRSHLDCREVGGKTVFCQRAHRGFDGPGLARRRKDGGDFFLTKCVPSECDLRQNAVEPNSKLSQIAREWQALYPDAVLVQEKQKRNKDNGRMETVFESAKCKHWMFFLFRLLTDEGEYAHNAAEFCLYDSHAETNHRILRRLVDIWAEVGGQLAGLRLQLVYSPVSTRYDKKGAPPSTPAWDIVIPEGTDLSKSLIQAMQRARLLRPDLTALPAETQNALALVDSPSQLARIIEESPSIVSLALSEPYRQMLVDAEKGDPAQVRFLFDHPMVAEICERMQLTAAQITWLPGRFGGNIVKFLYWARKKAAEYSFTVGRGEEQEVVKSPIRIQDIIDKHGWGDDQPPVDQFVEVAETDPPPPEDGVEEAQFTTVEDSDPQVAIDAAKGIVPSTPPVDTGLLKQYPELEKKATPADNLFGGRVK